MVDSTDAGACGMQCRGLYKDHCAILTRCAPGALTITSGPFRLSASITPLYGLLLPIP